MHVKTIYQVDTRLMF